MSRIIVVFRSRPMRSNTQQAVMRLTPSTPCGSVAQRMGCTFPVNWGAHIPQRLSKSGTIAWGSDALKPVGPDKPGHNERSAAGSTQPSAAFELRDEEHLAAIAQLLEITRCVVDCAIDRDGRFFFEVLAEAG